MQAFLLPSHFHTLGVPLAQPQLVQQQLLVLPADGHIHARNQQIHLLDPVIFRQADAPDPGRCLLVLRDLFQRSFQEHALGGLEHDLALILQTFHAHQLVLRQ